jgi:hypothetical protein
MPPPDHQNRERAARPGDALEIESQDVAEDIAADAGAQDWLRAEWYAAIAAATRCDFDALIGAGVSSQFSWRGPQRFGCAAIDAGGDGTYQPIEGEGRRAFIVPAIPVPAWDDPACDEFDPGDLIAFFLDDPRWWTRRAALPILNLEAVRRAAHFQRPLRVFASPLGWLRGAGDGILLLDEDIDLRFWLCGVPSINAETVALGEMIERRLRTPYRLPAIRVPRSGAE